MFKRQCLIFVLIISSIAGMAQTIPKEGSVLSYRIIGFSVDVPAKNGAYKLEIAKGNYDNRDSFSKYVFKAASFKDQRVIAEVPSWGADYTWRIVETAGQEKKSNSELHHFRVAIVPEVDSSKIRFRVLQAAKKYKDAYVFLDNFKALYDMNGNAVWFLPDTIAGKLYPGDMKPTPQGTISMLLNTTIYDIKYNGDVLLRKESVDSENYHHEITRLSNGNYMVLGSKHSTWRPRKAHSGDSTGDSLADRSLSRRRHPAIQFGTASELDAKGNLLWHWSSADYFLESEMNDDNPERPMFFLTDTRPNALYFDEKKKMLYMGLRNANCILKVKYPEGKVINDYQQGLLSRRDQGISLFCGQHSIGISKAGEMYMFDNNTCDTSAPSKLVVLREPGPGNSRLTKLWEYPFTYDPAYGQTSYRCGNAIELPDLSMFVCMGLPYSKTFIINRQKQVLWSALPEKWDAEKKKWEVVAQYRASLVLNRKELERMIWK